tara:strand:+ start:252 stop:1400 length:1149 start_codon:yes stop_codon:yes gene_type:complete
MKGKLNTGSSIFSVMTELSNECNAINLSQGFPGFNPDSRLLDMVCKYVQGNNNQYAPMAGIPALQECIATKIEKFYGRVINASEEITICDGATEALFSIIQAAVHPGDEVIVFDPAYDNYAPAIELANGITRHVPLIRTKERADYHIDWQRLKDTINSKTKLIILNFPHNPTGAILEAEDLEILADILRETSIYLMSDEVYEHIVFDNQQHLSLASHNELWERSFVISSFGKTFHATGWKVGYCAAPPLLTEELRQIHQWTCYSVVTPIQCGLAEFMQTYPEYIETLPKFYEAKRDHFCKLINHSQFTFTPSAGSFYQLLDYSSISDLDDVTFAKKLTKEIGVASIPISVFYECPPDEKKLRFCFAKENNILELAAEQLCAL